MNKLLSAYVVAAWLFAAFASAFAQTPTVWPNVITAPAVYDFGNGPIKFRLIKGNASVFTSQSSGVGSTAGSSTSLTLTATPTTPPCVGCVIAGTGITAGTTVAAYSATSITLSAATTVAPATALTWGAACPATYTRPNYIQASASADYLPLYTTARICAVSPGGPSDFALMLPYDTTSSGGGSVTFANPTATAGPTAINGVATTAMRSDAAPAVRLATIGQSGLMPAWPGTTTTYFRGDGTFPTLNAAALSGLGTGVATALGVNVGTAGSFVVNGGALGTPSSGVGTNITGLPLANITGLGTGVATALALTPGGIGSVVINGGALGTPSTANLTNATGLTLASGISGFGTGVAAQLAIAVSTAGGSTQTVAKGTIALLTSAISSGTCTATQQSTALNVVSTDVVNMSFNSDPTSSTGFAPVTTGMLTIIPWPTAGFVNFKECNVTGSSITPSPITLNWQVTR